MQWCWHLTAQTRDTAGHGLVQTSMRQGMCQSAGLSDGIRKLSLYIWTENTPPPPSEHSFIWKVKAILPISMKSLTVSIYIYIYIWLDNSSQSGYIGERILPTLTKACVGPWCSSGGNNNSWQWGQCATKPSAYDLETPCKKEVTWSPSCRRR